MGISNGTTCVSCTASEKNACCYDWYHGDVLVLKNDDLKASLGTTLKVKLAHEKMFDPDLITVLRELPLSAFAREQYAEALAKRGVFKKAQLSSINPTEVANDAKIDLGTSDGIVARGMVAGAQASASEKKEETEEEKKK